MESILNLDFPQAYLCIVLISVLLYAIFNGRNSRLGAKNLPPGPRGIPLLGNLLQMVNGAHVQLSKWAHQYGNLCTVYFGPKPALVVSDPKLMKEIFSVFPATGKFLTDTFLLVSQGSHGVGNSEGKVWVEQRQFCIKSLKEFGFGNNRAIEPQILQDAQELCTWIEKEQRPGKSLVVHKVLKLSALNTLWTIASGERVKYEDSQIAKLFHEFENALQYTIRSGLAFFPWLKYLSPGLSGYTGMEKASNNIHHFIEQKIAEHRNTFVEGEKRDLIDMYIEHLENVQQNEKEDSSFHGKAGVRNCVASINDIFLAGGETTSVTLNWALFYLSHHQQVQLRLQQEIDEVVGREREPSVSDKARMPYAEAVILETLRISSIIPFGVIHRLLEDVSFKGYKLPKDMLLIANMYHIHHNPDIWGDPEIFRPERFLSENSEAAVNLKDCVVAFQAGKRQCLGEILAKDILFLFLTKLFQKFHFAPDPTIPKEDYFTPDVGIILLTKPLGLMITPR